MQFKRMGAMALRWSFAGAMLLSMGACAGTSMSSKSAPAGIDPVRSEQALLEARAKRARGERVWCVPYARTASGVEIRGNAGTWWNAAKGEYERGKEPEIGAVMAFSATKKLPMGHVAVVSEVVSPREVLIDHANWKRNEVSLKMAVIDVSDSNDWSKVRVESQPGALGRVYPVSGFIYPLPEAAPVAEAPVAEAPVRGADPAAIADAVQQAAEVAG
jgi:hypothetical protein